MGPPATSCHISNLAVQLLNHIRFRPHLYLLACATTKSCPSAPTDRTRCNETHTGNRRPSTTPSRSTSLPYRSFDHHRRPPAPHNHNSKATHRPANKGIPTSSR